MTFCFVCRSCASRFNADSGTVPRACPNCDGEARRDYQTEAFGVGAGVKVSRDGLVADQARVFLPTNEEMAGPSDPDGTKGMRAWREGHAPKADNRKPHWPGTVERKVY